jgi:hypothetical protein
MLILVFYPEPEARDNIYILFRYSLQFTVTDNYNITSFFRFVNKRASYPFGVLVFYPEPEARDNIY